MAKHLWWLAAIVLGILELVTGSFYLLVIALGLACAGVAAMLGGGFSLQLLVAAVVSVLGSVLVHRFRSLGPKDLSPDRSPDLNLDIGQTVMVNSWAPDGTARVIYRGASWQAMLLPGHPARHGIYRIHAIQGSQLVLIPAESGQG
ncbi:MAG: NfeD family protein [Lautropia sp.]|nr:NfeD family protein [Lautropia sp.]